MFQNFFRFVRNKSSYNEHNEINENSCYQSIWELKLNRFNLYRLQWKASQVSHPKRISKKMNTNLVNPNTIKMCCIFELFCSVVPCSPFFVSEFWYFIGGLRLKLPYNLRAFGKIIFGFWRDIIDNKSILSQKFDLKMMTKWQRWWQDDKIVDETFYLKSD